MWKWTRRPVPVGNDSGDAKAPALNWHTGNVGGKYVLLYKYLEHRYADVVVLTFAQIEDLLGFALPDLAGTEAWWTMTETKGSPRYSDAWILADRTATPNLQAKTVVFERNPSPKPRVG